MSRNNLIECAFNILWRYRDRACVRGGGGGGLRRWRRTVILFDVRSDKI